MKYPAKVKIVEVGPRDGLQNEPQIVPLTAKVQLIDQLSHARLPYIEVGSCVSPKWVPQMDASTEIFQMIQKLPGIQYALLVPNLKGLDSAIAVGAQDILIFTSASEAFCQRNINCSIAESIQRFTPIFDIAKEKNMRVRGAVSCVLGCPYEGNVPPEQVRAVVQDLLHLGCYEVLLGDTIGIGSAGSTDRLLSTLTGSIAPHYLAGHYHDTYGQALANILISLQWGITTFDSSVAGLGGCPYAEGATGNVATEDVVYMLHNMGIETGVRLDALIQAGDFICKTLQRPNASRVAKAMLAKHSTTGRT